MKKKIIYALVGLLLLPTVVFASSYLLVDAPFKIFLNGTEYTSSNPVLEMNGTTYVSLRDVGTIFGANVSWDNNTESVIINTDNSIQVDSKNTDSKDDSSIVLDKNTTTNAYKNYSWSISYDNILGYSYYDSQEIEGYSRYKYYDNDIKTHVIQYSKLLLLNGYKYMGKSQEQDGEYMIFMDQYKNSIWITLVDSETVIVEALANSRNN